MKLVSMIVLKSVETKIHRQEERPFFSVKELKKLENQLGIGMFSARNYKCNECNKASDKTTLKVCCGCQSKGWPQHKHECKTKWRTTNLSIKSNFFYERTKANILKDKENNGAGTCMRVDIEIAGTFVFWLDTRHLMG